MEQIKNLKEFKALIKLYESITLDMLKSKPLKGLTGFGYMSTCTLCRAVNDECDVCAWVLITDDTCRGEGNVKTYEDIENNNGDLLIAIKARAKHMRETLKKGGYDVDAT